MNGCPTARPPEVRGPCTGVGLPSVGQPRATVSNRVAVDGKAQCPVVCSVVYSLSCGVACDYFTLSLSQRRLLNCPMLAACTAEGMIDARRLPRVGQRDSVDGDTSHARPYLFRRGEVDGELWGTHGAEPSGGSR
jgi:hypothetical protein